VADYAAISRPVSGVTPLQSMRHAAWPKCGGMKQRLIAAMLAAGAASGAAAAQPELGLIVGRATDSDDTDIVRLTYRRPLGADGTRPWWWPQQLQFGASVWRVPDLAGITRRYDLNVTPVWRKEAGFGYVEAGIGAYLLSHTINNDNDRLPSSFQFGSHIGAGLRLGESGQTKLGVGFQHLSNAGIKQPNGGINLYLMTLSVAL
jgi:hypothetical protein